MTERYSPLFAIRDEAKTYIVRRVDGATGDLNWSKAYIEKVTDQIASVKEVYHLDAFMEKAAKNAEFEAPSKA